jgi:hypothetical protein
VALTAAQRRALPRSAFVYAPTGTPRSSWRYPVPTRAQARAAGISEASRQRTHRAALAYSARRDTTGSRRTVASVVRKRAGTGQPGASRPRSRTRRAAHTRRTAGTRTSRAARRR